MYVSIYVCMYLCMYVRVYDYHKSRDTFFLREFRKEHVEREIRSFERTCPNVRRESVVISLESRPVVVLK